MYKLTLRLTQRHWRVLDALAQQSPQHRSHLPNGNGRTNTGGAKFKTMADLLGADLVAKVERGFKLTEQGMLIQRAGA